MSKTLIQLALLLSIVLSQPFSLAQTITCKSRDTYWVDLSDDGTILVAGDRGKTFVYLRQNDGTFEPSQTLTEVEGYSMVTDITADGSKLLEVDKNTGKGRVYENSNNTFTLAHTINPSNGSRD